MKRPIFIILLFLCLLNTTLFTACKSKHKIIRSKTPVEEKANSELFNDIISSSIDYSTFSSKLNLSLTSGTKTLSSKATLRIVKDNAIQISVQPLFGVEMFRFYIDPNKVILLDRMNKSYVEESITKLKEVYPVGFDFYTMQSMLTNAIFVTGKTKVENKDYRKFKYSQTSDLNYYLTAKDAESDIEYSFTANGDDRITSTHLKHKQEQLSLNWEYDEFAKLSYLIFPHRMKATINTEKNSLNSELRFSGIEMDDPFSISISIPNGYKKITIADILKIIAPDK